MENLTQEPTMADAQHAAREALGILSELPEFIQRFKQLWTALGITKEIPSSHQIAIWHRLYRENLMVLMDALRKTSQKAEHMEYAGTEFTLAHSVRFLSSVANGLKSKESSMKLEQTETQKSTQKPMSPATGCLGRIGAPKEIVAVPKPLTPDQNEKVSNG